MKSFVMAVCAVVLMCGPVCAGDCLSVSVVQGQHAHAQTVVVPSATVHLVQVPVISQVGISHTRLNHNVVAQSQSAGHTAQFAQTFAVPVVAHQAFDVRQQHCISSRQNVVVERRVRRERRGLARALFGR